METPRKDDMSSKETNSDHQTCPNAHDQTGLDTTIVQTSQQTTRSRVMDANEDPETPNISEELAKAEQLSAGSLSNEEVCDEDFQGDTWIEELECALLADCDPAALKKITEGRRIPPILRPDYWRALLALNDTGHFKLNLEFDLDNQLEIRQDCENLVIDIDTNLAEEPLSESDKLRLISAFESTLTTYVKARPELSYIPGNGWTDILRVLYQLELNDTQLYQMFFRIVDRYIPKDLSSVPPTRQSDNNPHDSPNEPDIDRSSIENVNNTSSPKNKTEPVVSEGQKTELNKSIQAYHLLRLLIQYHDPELCSILDSKKVTPNLYVKDWFCSLFARNCSPQLALLIWDTHFKMADPFLIFFAAIVMVVNASDELKRTPDQAMMVKVLKAMPSHLEEDDIEDLYYLVSSHYTNSTPRSIRSYSHLFFMDTFGNTYSGSESPEDGQPLLDLKTTQLTNSLDLSQYLCLPIVPAEIFALDTAQIRSSPTSSALRYFLVDCRPAEQYNAGHLARAFHLDCSLMLREPSSFATAVQALLEIQRQIVASKSDTGGRHLCFIGSGQEEEDQYVNMVVASFLQKYQKYVSIVVGGFEAIHDYVETKCELKDNFTKYIVDHDCSLCKICSSKFPIGSDQLKASQANLSTAGGFNPAQSLFATTTSFFKGDKGALSANALGKFATSSQASMAASLLTQSGGSMLDKFTTALVSKSALIRDRMVESLNATTMTSPTGNILESARGHVSSQDRLGKRYTGGSSRFAIDDNDDDPKSRGSPNESGSAGEPIQEIQVDVWQKEIKPLAFYKCAQIKGTSRYPGYIALTKTHLWMLREIPHNKGFASISAKRPLDMIVQITSKRRQPDLIIFRYGYQQQTPTDTSRDQTGSPDAKTNPSKGLPSIVASDHLHIPKAFELIRLIKREIVRIIDESSKGLRDASLGQTENASHGQIDGRETGATVSGVNPK